MPQPSSDENRILYPVYELQLLAIGMFLADPDLLDEFDENDFSMHEFIQFIKALKYSGGPSKGTIVRDFLRQRGISDDWKEGERARDRVVEAVKVHRRASGILNMASGAAANFEKMDIEDKKYFIRNMESIKKDVREV